MLPFIIGLGLNFLYGYLYKRKTFNFIILTVLKTVNIIHVIGNGLNTGIIGITHCSYIIQVQKNILHKQDGFITIIFLMPISAFLSSLVFCHTLKYRCGKF